MSPKQIVPKVEAHKSVLALMQQAESSIKAVLPKHLNPDRLAKIALGTLRRTPALLNCDPRSFVGAVVQAATLGLEPADGLNLCYIIPYKGDAQFQLGYGGMIELAFRSGLLKSIYAQEVYRDDVFNVMRGTEPKIVHEPNFQGERDEQAIAYVYAVATLMTGGTVFEVMTREQIESIRARSPAANKGFSPWKTDWMMMARKTVLKRLWKVLPKSPEMQRAINLDTAADAGEAQDFDLQIADAEIKEAEQKDDPLDSLGRDDDEITLEDSDFPPVPEEED